eukprot:TRINITY_DN11516_c0_g1_i1.p1 TRINITY_DN11516_c0_g1~~TRINITY_DN11516_c0_g1_i1.p1  ORF type:complete len:65 (+),score=1.50 TRINITY_DN11516_c0_g1_i1:100-294(+)
MECNKWLRIRRIFWRCKFGIRMRVCRSSFFFCSAVRLEGSDVKIVPFFRTTVTPTGPPEVSSYQ